MKYHSSYQSKMVTIPTRLLQQCQGILSFNSNGTLQRFVKQVRSQGAAPLATITHILEVINEIYWNDLSLSQVEKGEIKQVYEALNSLQKDARRTHAPTPAQRQRSRVPERKSPGRARRKKERMTLDEIRKRQQERRTGSITWDSTRNLIKLGKQNPELRSHILKIFKYMT